MHSTTTSQDAALFALRVIIAAIFLYAGYVKIGLWSADPAATGMAPWLYNMMLFLSVTEPIGALAVLIGFLTRTAALSLAIIMAGAIYVVITTMGMGFVTPTGAGWNFNLMILAGCFVLGAFGPGKWSVHGMWHRALNRPLRATV